MDNFEKKLNEKELYGYFPYSVEKNVKELEAEGANWQQIGQILAGAPSTNVALKGGNWSAELWQSVISEFQKFLCTDSEDYSKLKNDGEVLKEKSVDFLIATLSSIIGSKVGIAEGIIVPLIVWLFLVISKIGKEALCKSIEKPANERL